MLNLDVRFDADSCSADAIQRAAYKFSGRLALDLRHVDDAFLCSLAVVEEVEDEGAALLAEFRTEVLDQVLRERIRLETAGVRNLILALAFSRADIDTDG